MFPRGAAAPQAEPLLGSRDILAVTLEGAYR
jgi:hypothetical protein